MSFLNRLKRAWNALTVADTTSDTLLEWLGIDSDTPHEAVNEITYYTCLKMLSETMGKLPLKYYQQTESGRQKAEMSQMSYLLTVRPNSEMTPTTLFSTLEMNRQHYGNAYLWMRGEFTQYAIGGKYDIKDVWVVPSEYVEVTMDDAGVFGGKGELHYIYSDPRTGAQYDFRQYEILHFKTWYSLDGVMGEPVRNILKNSVDGMIEGQKYLNNLYENGLSAAMAMQYTGDLDEGRIKLLKKRFADTLTGSQNAGKVIPIPIGLTLTPLKMSLADSQFYELRKYTALQIAAAFGIKPNQLNDYEKSSYANSEMQQLAFLVDTMSYALKSYEEEINAKALSPKDISDGYFFKFNEKAILRTDTATQMEALAKAVNNGIYTPNEARGYLDLTDKEGGDQLIVNGNYIPITKVGQQYNI